MGVGATVAAWPGSQPAPTPPVTAPVEQTPTPSPQNAGWRSPSAKHWPGPENTGPRPGTRFQPYDGPCDIKEAGVRIVDRVVTCRLSVTAHDLVISNSRIVRVDVTDSGSARVEDSLADSGAWFGPTVGGFNITVLRSDIRGGQHSVQCAGNCLVQDSWLHDQSLPASGAWHNNAFITNGGSRMTLRHNTLACTPENNASDGGCTADLSLFGDFAPLAGIVIEGNLLAATPGGYCGSFGHNPGKKFGESPAGVRVSGNVFEPGPAGRCGAYGPVTSFLAAPGNEWIDNVWVSGEAVQP